MNREQKAAVVEELAAQIQEADAIFAVDYRGLSVTQAVELRSRLGDVDATFRVVKNRLTERAVDKAGADSLRQLLEGPTAFTFVRGDAALAAKTIATFGRENRLLEFKGGTMEGEPLSVEEVESISRLPARDALQAHFVGVLASPITGLVRGLGSLISGLAIQLGEIQERGLIGDGSRAEAPGDPVAEAEDGATRAEAPGDPVAEAEAAEQEATSEASGDPPGTAQAANEEE